MDVSRMHCMIEKLSECAKAEFDKGIENIDTCEMGQVTDMLKDLAEAMYYRTLTNSMEEFEPSDLLDAVERYGDRRFYDDYRYKNGRFAPKGRGTRRGYEEPPYYHQMPSDYREWENLPEKERMRDLDLMRGRMYFSEPISDAKGEMRDRNEGRSGLYRKAYMESKELHKGNTQQDKEAKIKELEKYMKELSEDMAELVADMSPEERTMTKTKLTTLVSKM